MYCNRLKFLSLADNRLVNIQPNVFAQHMLINDYANRNPGRKKSKLESENKNKIFLIL